MSGPPNAMSVRAEVVRDPDSGDYVLAIVDISTTRQIATISLPADVIVQALARDLQTGLELRPDGTVVAFVDHGDTPDLATKTLADLVAGALSVVSPEDDATDLATLERMLEAALVAVQQERRRLAAASGR